MPFLRNGCAVLPEYTYRLDDSARKDVVNMIDALLINHTDPERDKEIKSIKGW